MALSNSLAVTDDPAPPPLLTLRTLNVSVARLRSEDTTDVFDVDDLIPATTNTNLPAVPAFAVGELNNALVGVYAQMAASTEGEDRAFAVAQAQDSARTAVQWGAASQAFPTVE